MSIARPPPRLAIVIPAFNERAVIGETVSQLLRLLDDLDAKGLAAKESFLLFVDDGSEDGTWEALCERKLADGRIRGLRLSRNFGHQNALIAGLTAVVDESDVNVCIDADLQHDISLIEGFLRKHIEGHDIVYGVKNERRSDTLFKKTSATLYYKLLRLFGVNVVYNHADFRLLSKRALVQLLQYQEVNLFLRGIIPMLGFKSTSLHYDVKERMAGESKYPLRKMISLAIDGITSFSVVPLRMVSILGFVSVLISIVNTALVFYDYFRHQVVPGWSTVVVSIYFVGGIQLVSLGVIGEYLGKLYFEVKARPRFIIDRRL